MTLKRRLTNIERKHPTRAEALAAEIRRRCRLSEFDYWPSAGTVALEKVFDGAGTFDEVIEAVRKARKK